jgi:hypothetical protein
MEFTNGRLTLNLVRQKFLAVPGNLVDFVCQRGNKPRLGFFIQIDRGCDA